MTYTALFGDYDTLCDPYFVSSGSETVCFTDQEGLASGRWDVRVVKRRFDDPTRDARMMKVLSHRMFPDAEVTIWVDANLALVRALGQEVLYLLRDRSMAVYSHDARTCAYAEAKACHLVAKDDGRVMAHQMARYRRAGFPENFGLASTNFLVRRNTSDVAVFNEAWWSEIENGSRRDQLSFDYCRWKIGTKLRWIEGTIWDCRFFLPRAHKV